MLQNVRNLSTFSALPQKNDIEKIGKLNFRGLIPYKKQDYFWPIKYSFLQEKIT